jgi:hypothetical protein
MARHDSSPHAEESRGADDDHDHGNGTPRQVSAPVRFVSPELTDHEYSDQDPHHDKGNRESEWEALEVPMIRVDGDDRAEIVSGVWVKTVRVGTSCGLRKSLSQHQTSR